MATLCTTINVTAWISENVTDGNQLFNEQLAKILVTDHFRYVIYFTR